MRSIAPTPVAILMTLLSCHCGSAPESEPTVSTTSHLESGQGINCSGTFDILTAGFPGVLTLIGTNDGSGQVSGTLNYLGSECQTNPNTPGCLNDQGDEPISGTCGGLDPHPPNPQYLGPAIQFTRLRTGESYTGNVRYALFPNLGAIASMTGTLTDPGDSRVYGWSAIRRP
jgi:hypothetical protein